MEGVRYIGEEKNVSRQRTSMLHISVTFALLASVLALSLVVYHEVRISKIEKEQRLLQRVITTLSRKLMQPVDDLDEAHVVSKRDVDSSENSEDLLSRLSIHDLSALRGSPGRDGRDGRDGKDCDTSDLGKIFSVIANASHSTSTGATFDQDGLLRRLNETIGFALLRGIDDTKRKLAALSDELSNAETPSHSEAGSSGRTSSSSVSVRGGSTYVRWGRTTCSNTSEMIYTGFAAGQHNTHTGGASNYQCLPLQPEYSTYLNGNQGNWIYGAEYQTGSNLFPNAMQDHNVPCARCYTPSRSATMMIPARRTCPNSWTKEYEGYLMAGHYSQKRAYAYECVDKDPESIAGLHANKDGALFYFVQASCPDTHHCPPYIQAAELTCVVCTK